MNRIILLVIILLNVSLVVNSQTQLVHQKKVFVSPAGKIYFNKALPVYFRVSTSPDENAPSYLLKSESSPKYSNPMYFDSEGKNTLRSPSAVDTATKKVIEPKQDILFDVYADGAAPSTSIKITSNKKYIADKTTYYGKNTKTEITSTDDVSGVEALLVSVNNAAYQNTTAALTFDEEKDYDVKYYSVDNVGNVESPGSIKFSVDITAPKTTLAIIGENKGKVLSSKASILLSAKDTLSGLNRIVYAINDGAEKVYTAPIPLSVFKDGNTKVSYYAIDNVGNKEDVKVVSTSTEKPENNESSYSFYIDKEAPVVSFEIVGDQFKGKSLFISERSKFQINAADEKSGVEKVSYAQNKQTPSEAYSEPFLVTGSGPQNITFAASDYVGNMALAQTQQVVVDKSVPKSSLSFTGKQFFNRDTLFITKDTRLTISSHDNVSGVQKTTYLIDGNTSATYSQPVTIEKEGFHTIEFQATDNVNNTESSNSKSFYVDNSAPEIHYNFSVKAIGTKTIRDQSYAIYPSNAMLYIAATDNASGGEHIEYKVNGKQSQTVIPVKGFLPGNYEIEIVAYDVLKNKSTQVIRFSIEN
jgi:hypothetical protein